ncbi:hypothetical protein E2562_036235 [Oryza meyeriana var. granulata]|uniref:Uncharacterized protein n=1 Tax=Oryza meyeriana var. granulata TaxID=110450 RepID=A0A6G1ET87_9ORYZ|nr:hypothetical protein E2562_036235 [Oryza meyeriana var. granulata]
MVFCFTPTLAGPAVGPARQVLAYPLRALINVSSTDEPTTDAGQSEELQVVRVAVVCVQSSSAQLYDLTAPIADAVRTTPLAARAMQSEF